MIAVLVLFLAGALMVLGGLAVGILALLFGTGGTD